MPYEGAGTCAGAHESITVLLTNFCPPTPGWCTSPNDRGFDAHFDLIDNGLAGKGWSKSIYCSYPFAIAVLCVLALVLCLLYRGPGPKMSSGAGYNGIGSTTKVGSFLPLLHPRHLYWVFPYFSA